MVMVFTAKFAPWSVRDPTLSLCYFKRRKRGGKNRVSEDWLIGVSYNVRNTSLGRPSSRKGGYGEASLECLELLRRINSLSMEHSLERSDKAGANTHRYSRDG